jgi:hypothetical protein
MSERTERRRYVDGSTVVTAAGTLVGATETAVRRLREVASSSRSNRTVASAVATLEDAVVGPTLENAVTASTLGSASRVVGRWGRRSFVYRWLTADPEPEVVVDLGDTRSVGWLIALCRRVRPGVDRVRERSRAARAYDSASSSVRSAPVRAGSLVVLVATLGHVAAASVGGGISPPAAVVATFVVAVAALGARVRASWADLSETRTAESLRRVVLPPPPEDDGE